MLEMRAEMHTTRIRCVCPIWTKTETARQIHVKLMNINFRGII